MNSERWQPVEKNTWKTDDPPQLIRIEYGDTLTAKDEFGAATVTLPDDLSLCRRAPDESIGYAELERDGWQIEGGADGDPRIDPLAKPYVEITKTVGDYSLCLSLSQSPTVCIEREFEFRGDVHYEGLTINVRTMQDLRALVKMLGGAHND